MDKIDALLIEAILALHEDVPLVDTRSEMAHRVNHRLNSIIRMYERKRKYGKQR